MVNICICIQTYVYAYAQTHVCMCVCNCRLKCVHCRGVHKYKKVYTNTAVLSISSQNFFGSFLTLSLLKVNTLLISDTVYQIDFFLTFI